MRVSGGEIQKEKRSVPTGRDRGKPSPPEFISTSILYLRYHPMGYAVRFTAAQCEAAIEQAGKEFPGVLPKKDGTTIWYLQHPEYQAYKAINRARDLLFLWRIPA